MPASRNVLTDWPSFVLEVGYSELLSVLRGDLQFWLQDSNGQIRVAILLHIDIVQEMILIERWEVVPCVRPTRANVSYPLTPQMAESILLYGKVAYIGPPLLISAAQVFDVVLAHTGAGQFTLNAGDLDCLNNQFWHVLSVAPKRY